HDQSGAAPKEVARRAAGEGLRNMGIDGHCESAHKVGTNCLDTRRWNKEAEARKAGRFTRDASSGYTAQFSRTHFPSFSRSARRTASSITTRSPFSLIR